MGGPPPGPREFWIAMQFGQTKPKISTPCDHGIVDDRRANEFPSPPGSEDVYGRNPISEDMAAIP